MTTTWRVIKKCDDCPFSRSGPGLTLRKSLGPSRWAGILSGLRGGNYFPCHKTTHNEVESEEAPSRGLVCAGSIEWQDRNGASSAYVRLCRAREEGKVQRVPS